MNELHFQVMIIQSIKLNELISLFLYLSISVRLPMY